MYENSERVEQFKAEIADMKLRDPATSLDRLLSRLGLLGLGGGVVVGVVAYFVSHGTTNPLQQRDAIVLGLLAVTLALVGGALWLKAALAGFLRFWIARVCYEQQAQADRVVAAVTGAPAASPNSGGREPAAGRAR
ncbi:MAG TPA: hypothetical protein VIL48_14385 [Acidimicrobiales bacterium]